MAGAGPGRAPGCDVLALLKGIFALFGGSCCSQQRGEGALRVPLCLSHNSEHSLSSSTSRESLWGQTHTLGAAAPVWEVQQQHWELTGML